MKKFIKKFMPELEDDPAMQKFMVIMIIFVMALLGTAIVLFARALWLKYFGL